MMIAYYRFAPNMGILVKSFPTDSTVTVLLPPWESIMAIHGMLSTGIYMVVVCGMRSTMAGPAHENARTWNH